MAVVVQLRVSPEEGEAVVSSFSAAAMPLLREGAEEVRALVPLEMAVSQYLS